jgi:nickel/cobalt exporter
MTVTLALMAAAVSIGSLHALAPDHWVPFAALGRAERWSARRTAAVTAACGFGHVTVSVALGLLAVFFGRELLEAFGERLEGLAGLLLVGFGAAYGLWGLQRTLRERAHEHAHSHGYAHSHRHGHSHSHGVDRNGAMHRPLTAWTLFLLFSADTCVAVIPLMFASAPLGWASTLAIAAAYEVATIGTMVLLVLPARAAIERVRGAWADRWGDALAGGVVASVGIVVMSLGI